LRGLLDGIAASCAAAPNAPRHIMITGSLVGCPPAARALVEAMGRHGIDAAPPRDLPILDGALPMGAARLAQ